MRHMYARLCACCLRAMCVLYHICGCASGATPSAETLYHTAHVRSPDSCVALLLACAYFRGEKHDLTVLQVPKRALHMRVLLASTGAATKVQAYPCLWICTCDMHGGKPLQRVLCYR
jgi:hypothetical protein